MGLPRRIGSTAWSYIATVAGVGAAALVSTRLDDTLNTLNISLIYLFVVLVAATSYGYGPAILASVLCFLSFYFEFYPPYGFNSDVQVEDWLTLFFFLSFAVAISRLASAARMRAEEARARAAEALAREHELACLQHLGKTLQGGGDDLQALLDGVVEQVRSTFGLRRCALLLADQGGTLHERAAAGAPALAGGATLDLPLQTSSAPLGLLRLEQAAPGPPFEAGELRVLTTFADQAAVAIERAMLTGAARDAAVFREADRLKTSLLRLISHDLRTPLATIKARASSLLEGDVTLDTGEWQESMRAIDDEADRLERLVGAVLDLSRIEAGALHPRMELYTADEVVSAIMPHLERAASRHRLLLDIPEELPPVPLDITLIGQVLTNLLENAFKYAPAGSTVRLRASARDGGLLLCVADEGPGIPPEQRERVFDAFWRLERSREKGTRGAGLGLAICRGLIAAHAGWIRVEETSGGGATFLLWLPGEPIGSRGTGEHAGPAGPSGARDTMAAGPAPALSRGA